MNNPNKVCSFFGHRKIEIDTSLAKRLRDIIENLILTGYNTFLFGSNSEFDDLCYKLVTDLQINYPNIKMIGYPLKSEVVFLKEEKEKLENLFLNVLNFNTNIKAYDEIIREESLFNAGKSSYVQRNKLIIDKSDFIIFFYRESSTNSYKSKSGTKIALEYAKKRNKDMLLL